MKGYQALQIAVEEGKRIQLGNKWYEYKNDRLVNQDNQNCSIGFLDLMSSGWEIKAAEVPQMIGE